MPLSAASFCVAKGNARAGRRRPGDSGQAGAVVQRPLKFNERSTRFQRSLKQRAVTAPARGTTMNRLTIRSVRACAAAAAALCAVPAALAQTAPATRPAASSGLEEITVTARRRDEALQDVPVAISAFSSDDLRAAAGRRPRRAAGQRAEPEPGAGPRLGDQRQRLHPRHRPARRAADLRPGRRHLPRRRVHLAHPGRAVQPVRRGARRGAARPAGHAVRQEHHRRRDPPGLEEAARRSCAATSTSATATTTASTPRAISAGRSPTRSASSIAGLYSHARRHRRGPVHRSRVQRHRHGRGPRDPVAHPERRRSSVDAWPSTTRASAMRSTSAAPRRR